MRLLANIKSFQPSFPFWIIFGKPETLFRINYGTLKETGKLNTEAIKELHQNAIPEILQFH